MDGKILIVDDEKEIADLVEIYLVSDGYRVFKANNAQDGLSILENEEVHLVLLDIMMPGMNGYETCQGIREQSNVPILFLSARTTDSDKILGFSSGGDDYLEKPFSYPELIGRAKALIRRYHVYRGKEQQAVVPPKQISVRGLLVDLQREEVFLEGKKIELTSTEYEMLRLLASNRRQIFSAQRLYESVWNDAWYYGANNTVMVHIRNLRQKIERDPKNPVFIKTVWGKGYHLD